MVQDKIMVLTGFEAFGGFKLNPSWETVKTFEGKHYGPYKIKVFKIPLIYTNIKPAITGIIDDEKPNILLCLGQSYRPVISLEKVAINYADLTEAHILYNCMTQPKDEILEKTAPAAYFSNLLLRKILSDLRENKIPSQISYTAGTFGCNQIFFHILHKIYEEKLKIIAGFIHVPSLPSQSAQLQLEKNRRIPSMSLSTIKKALKIIISSLIEDKK